MSMASVKSFLTKSEIIFACNHFHFFVFEIVLIAISLIFPLFWLLFIIYSIYVFKNFNFFKPYLVIFVLFFSLFIIFDHQTSHLDNQNEIIVKIIDVKTEDDLTKIICKYQHHKILIYYSDQITIYPGYQIKCYGKTYQKNETANFDSISYYHNILINDFYNAYKIEILEENFSFRSLRYRFFDCLKRKSDVKVLPYISSLLLGINTFDENIYQAFSNLGITHLFAISGLHISILALIIELILKKIHLNDEKSEDIACIFLAIYVIFTGFLTSAIRASLFFIIKRIRNKYDLDLSNLDIFSLVFVLALLFNPLIIYTSGFMFTYLISFGLILSSDLFSDNNKIKNAILVSLFINLLVLPISINSNYSYNLLSAFLNPLLIIFFSTFFLPLMMVLALIPKISFLIRPIVVIFEGIIKSLSNLDFFIIRFGNFNIYLTAIYYILFIFIWYLLENKRLKQWHIYLFVSFLLIVSNIRFFSINNQVEFINVGQGDSTLISLKNNQENILIDSYNNVNYLKKRSVHNIDYLIITHGDNDHIESAIEVIDYFHVNYVYTNYYDNQDSTLEVEKHCIDNDIEFIRVGRGDLIKTKYLNIDVLSPSYNYQDDNENSLVLRFVLDNYSYLMLADVGTKILDILISDYGSSIKSNIVHVAHHGSINSDNLEFYRNIEPSLAVISVAKYNKYNHPSKVVLNHLSNLKIPYYITYEKGTIIVKTRKKKRYVEFIK